MLDLRHINSFLAVIDTGSFHAAARRLGLSQPTISQHVRRLEMAIGSTLVRRNRGHCEATGAGIILVPAARRLLTIASRAVHRIAEMPVMVGASTNIGTYLLPAELRRWRDRSDARTTLVDVVIAPNPEIIEKLEAGEIDIALTEWPHSGEGFVSRLWRRERLVVIVPPDHPWAERHEIPLELLFTTPLLGGERGTGTASLLRRVLGDAAARLRVQTTLGSTEAVKRAVTAGLGVSLVAESAVVDEARSSRLRVLSIAGIELVKELFVTAPPEEAAGMPLTRLRELFVAADEATLERAGDYQREWCP